MTRLEIEPTPRASGDARAEMILLSPNAAVFDGVKDYVRQAIRDGDMLPNVLHETDHCAKRRALIIAPVYREPGQKYTPLPSDAADVKLVHEMLLHFGYESRDIRILCDVCGGFNGRADPTRENILQSLEWLVEGASDGDRRFSTLGHGDRVLGDSLSGKRARRVEPRLNIPGAWNVDTERSSSRVFFGRVKEQVISEDELVYYNEGIITRLTEARDGSAEGECADKILDSELNQYLSRLPEGCTITNYIDESTSSASSVPAVVEPTVPRISRAVYVMMKVVPRLMRYAREVMQEGIPDQERDLDRIKARIFAWGACHQRQESWETNDRSAGLFTRTFTETCLRLAGSGDPLNEFSYNQLFNEVSQQVAEKRACSGSGWGNSKPAPQFVQLWTSLKNVDSNDGINLLDSPVVF
ncbi:hypothetical protein OPQ81_009062 [Rhizoctonia solani]|nr:hypothetical protein OPQ81_009062 [Rhizoctonia solani]